PPARRTPCIDAPQHSPRSLVGRSPCSCSSPGQTSSLPRTRCTSFLSPARHDAHLGFRPEADDNNNLAGPHLIPPRSFHELPWLDDAALEDVDDVSEDKVVVPHFFVR